MLHSRAGIFHSFAARFNTRNKSFSPRVLAAQLGIQAFDGICAVDDPILSENARVVELAAKLATARHVSEATPVKARRPQGSTRIGIATNGFTAPKRCPESSHRVVRRSRAEQAKASFATH